MVTEAWSTVDTILTSGASEVELRRFFPDTSSFLRDASRVGKCSPPLNVAADQNGCSEDNWQTRFPLCRLKKSPMRRWYCCYLYSHVGRRSDQDFVVPKTANRKISTLFERDGHFKFLKIQTNANLRFWDKSGERGG